MNVVEAAVKKAKTVDGKTQETLAEEIGVTRVSVQQWIRQGYVSENYVMRFAKATGVAPWTINKLAKELAEAAAA